MGGGLHNHALFTIFTRLKAMLCSLCCFEHKSYLN